MKTIKFRPFRYANGQVIVTDYRAWHKVRNESQEGNRIVVVADLTIVPEMQVIDKKGRKLYFPTSDWIRNNGRHYSQTFVNCMGYDVEGVPCLNHYYRIQDSTDSRFEPLMTSRVVREFNDMIDRFNLNIQKLLK